MIRNHDYWMEIEENELFSSDQHPDSVDKDELWKWLAIMQEGRLNARDILALGRILNLSEKYWSKK